METPMSFLALGPSRSATITSLFEATKATVESQGLEFRPTSCMGALLAVIEKHKNDPTTVDAASHILAEIGPQVPRAVFQTQFSQLGDMIGKTLSAHRKNQFIVNSLLQFSGAMLLKVDPTTLKTQLAEGMFQRIAEHMLARDETIHKSCVNTTVSLLAMPHRPAYMVKSTVETIHNHASVLVSPASEAQNQKSAKKFAHLTDSPAVLISVAIACLPTLPQNAITAIVKTISRLSVLGNTSISCAVFGCFEKCFSAAVPQLTMAQRTELYQIILSLQPDLNNVPVAISFFSAMGGAYSSIFSPLHEDRPSDFEDAFFRAMQMVVHAFGVEDYQVARRAVAAGRNIIFTTLRGGYNTSLAVHTPLPSNLDAVISEVASGMQLRCKHNWTQCLRLVQSLFEGLGAHASPILDQLLISIGGLFPLILPTECGNSLATNTSPLHLRSALVECMGSAVAAVGPANFLRMFPLEPDANGEFTRPWVVNCIRHNAVGTQLAHFATAVIPLADRCIQLQQKVLEEEKEATARNLQWRHAQLWSLLVAFCNRPTDIPEAFPRFAKPLADTLTSQPSVRIHIANALTNLITDANKDIAFYATQTHQEKPTRTTTFRHTQDGATKVISTITTFARNFLPHLFTLFMSSSTTNANNAQQTSESATTAALLTCIGAFASLAEKQLVSGMVRQVITKALQSTKLLSEATDVPTFDKISAERQGLCDLAVCLAPYTDEEAANLLLRMACPQLKEQDHRVQKKAYKILCEVLKCHAGLSNTKSSEVMGSVLGATDDCSPNSRVARLGLIRQLVEYQTTESLVEFAKQVVVEVVLGTKESGKETRETAYEILLAFGHKFESCRAEQGGVLEFHNLLLAGLGGTDTSMLSASILALARLLYEFSDTNSCGKMVATLLNAAQVLLAHPIKEVVRATLGMIRICHRVSETKTLRPLMPALVHAIMTTATENNGRFHQQVRVLLERFGRKFSFEDVYEWVPEEHKKLAIHVRKQFERTKRLKKQIAESHRKSHQDFEKDLNDDDEGDGEADDAQKKKWKAKKASNDVRLHETGTDEPMDLLDNAALARSLTKQSPKKRKLEEGFSVDDQGKMVIDDEDEDDDKHDPKKQKLDRDEMVTMEDVAKSKAEIASNKRQKVGEGQNVSYNRPNLSSLKNKRNKPEFSIKHTGDEYAPKAHTNAKGDIKKAGRPDPFAYIPLSRLQLNKRFKHKVSKAVKGVARLGRKKTGKK